MASPSPPPSRPLAAVRLEVRGGGARSTVYEVGEGGFLIGSVPGCDLRLPGTNVAPVLCLIARLPGGASLRKLAPVAPVTVNDRPAGATYLSDGDRVGLGPVEIIVRLSAVVEAGPIAALDVLEEQCRRQAQRIEELTAQLGQQAAAPAPPAEDDSTRRELARIRRELVDRYQKRRDRLLRQQQAIHAAGRKLQARKRDLDAREGQLAPRELALGDREIMAEASAEQVTRERDLLDEQHRLFAARQQELSRDLAERTADIESREATLREEKTALEKGQKLHQADLVRLDRIQASTEARQKQLAERALEVDRRFEQLQRDSRDLEEQAAQLDEWHNRLSAEAEQLEARKKEHEAAATAAHQRAAALEGQQAMLATLRTRLERMRDELRSQEQALADARTLHEASEADIQGRLEEAERLRGAVVNDKQLFDEERRRFEERRALLEQAVAQLRSAREALEAEQAAAVAKREQLDADAALHASHAEALLTRGEQIEQLGERQQADRQAMTDRAEALSRAEQALGVLQGQVRRRADELDARQKEMERGEQDLADRAAKVAEQLGRHEDGHRRASAELGALRGELAERAAALEQQAAALAESESALAEEQKRQAEARHTFISQQQALAAQRLAWEVEREAGEGELRELREELRSLADIVPEMELRGAAALERMDLARQQLREHLAEVHAYARQGREDIEAARRQVQTEADRQRQQEVELREGRDEHRLAVAAFRQQLIEWQGRVAEMRQALRLGGARLEHQKAHLEEQARQVATTTARLAEEAQELQRQRRHVAERRGEVEQHLGDMREWYRRKWRELAGVDPPPGEPGEGDVVPLPAAGEGAVLAMADEVAPADRQLGERLAGLELVDADTLQALWAEARRQRRPLRQLLLAEGYLTLYQMALIEAGNLDGLVLGPVRVIDKLPSTPREAVYRVFDPRRNAEAILRHLAEPEMYDAVRPDEFIQRFTAAAGVSHPNVAALLEVLTIAGRPAALVEYVPGVASGDWPALAAAPGVWYRLLSQAAVGLQAAHAAGLCHGHLDAASLVLTPKGALKLIGLGEPRWLAGADGPEEGIAADLAALGAVAGAWSRLAPGSKGARPKPLPEGLLAVLARLHGQGEPILSAQALVEELERVSAQVPPSSAAWDRLLRHLREQAPVVGLRHSA